MINDIHDDLITVYSPQLFGAISQTSITKEEDAGAKVRTITLTTSGELFDISKCFIGAKQGLFYQNNQPRNPMNRNCDGIIIAELDGQKYIIFLELKSSYSIFEVNEAQHQIMCSYYCLMAEFHGLLHFNYSDFKMCCMVASHPLSDEDKTKFEKWKLTTGIDKCREKALHFAVFPDQKFELLRSDIDELIHEPLNTTHVFSSIPMFHLPVDFNSDSGTFNIDKLLAQV